ARPALSVQLGAGGRARSAGGARARGRRRAVRASLCGVVRPVSPGGARRHAGGARGEPPDRDPPAPAARHQPAGSRGLRRSGVGFRRARRAVSAPAARAELEALLRAALAAVAGGRRVREALRAEGGTLSIAGRPVPREARLVVAAAGKAAAEMAAAFEEVAGPRIARGWLVTRPGHADAAVAAGRLPA